jgi:opacity protein-like surface antigen
MRAIARLLGVGVAVLAMTAFAAEDDEGAAAENSRFDDTRRFYLYVDSGHAFQLYDDFGGDARLDSTTANYVLGGGGGYNFTRHWGLEIQGHGTEPDVRSQSRGKIEELSNITIIPAVRFRYPLLENRLMPYLTAGVGWSMSDINDTGDLKVKVDMDEQGLAGTVGAGIEYFVAPNVAFGLSAQAFIYGEADTEIVVRDQANRIVSRSEGAVDLTSVALLAHVRMFFGEQYSAEEGNWRDFKRLFFARHGPFDTDDLRFYLYSLTGHTFIMDKDYGNGIRMEAPGDFNATLGGGIGVNLSRHWGFEIDMLNSEPELDAGAIGKFVELSNFTVMPAVRYRYGLCDRRLVLSAKAGVGAAFYNLNDARETADVFQVNRAVQTPIVEMDDTSVAGMLSVGFEYFLNHNISVGVSIPYFIYPDVDTVTQRREQNPPPPPVRSSMNQSGVGVLLMIRAYVP